MQYFNTGRTVIHYRDTGPKDGTNIVFSNALGTDSRIWDKVVRELPSNFRIITYDKRGHGLSGEPKEEISISDLAVDVSDLIDHLKLTSVNFVGISIGGMIGQVLAFERPRVISRLVLCDTAVKIGSLDLWDERINRIQSVGLADMADGILARWFSRDYRMKNMDEMNILRSMLIQTSEIGYLECCRAISKADLSEIAPKLIQPTRVLVGSDDLSTPSKVVRSTSDIIKNSKFDILGNSGHLPCIDNAELLANLIAEFVGEL